MAVPLWVMVCVGRFPVYINGQIAISLWFNNGVQEGDGTILHVVLHCKLDGWINTVDVLLGVLFVDFLLDDKCVIHIPAPKHGVRGSTESF